MHRVILSISRKRGKEAKAEAISKILPLIEAGISDEELLKTVAKLEAEML